MLLDWGAEPKTRRRAIPKAVKQTVWSKYIGANKAEGKCYVCKKTIHMNDFDVGHNKARAKGGSDSITNLRAICRMCNSAMGTTSIETFKKRFFNTASRGAASKKAAATGRRKTSPAKGKRAKKKEPDLFDGFFGI